MKQTGLIGYPVGHSLSPVIHRYWANQYHIDTQYDAFAVPPEELSGFMGQMREKGLAGVNVTVPHKQAVMPFLDGLDAVAKRIGAVNTIIRNDDLYIGSNTDAVGFVSNLKQFFPQLQDYLKQVVLLGAGGATRAAIVGLQDAGAEQILVMNRTEDAAAILVRDFGVNMAPWGERNARLEGATLLVNTTSLGMRSKPDLELDISHLPTQCLVHDIVYSPLETPLLASARARGNPVVDGLGMLLYQAQHAFYLWHGILPVVDAALRDYVLAAKAAGDAA